MFSIFKCCTYGVNLSAPFIIQVPPFKVVKMKILLNEDVFFDSVTVATAFTEARHRGERCGVHREEA